ncbi:MAG: hypothetical protein H6Q71_693 [Firmicutes bacterium]|nr:hypothetical protein [Bacillota bacterium]
MSRHSPGTGNVRPVPPLDMEEVKFWLHIMEEHALFIKTGLPFDKPDLIEEAATFEREFKALRVRADKLTSEKKFAELIAESIDSLKEFLRYKQLSACWMLLPAIKLSSIIYLCKRVTM